VGDCDDAPRPETISVWVVSLDTIGDSVFLGKIPLMNPVSCELVEACAWHDRGPCFDKLSMTTTDARDEAPNFSNEQRTLAMK
jgi:hypothetical protein